MCFSRCRFFIVGCFLAVSTFCAYTEDSADYENLLKEVQALISNESIKLLNDDGFKDDLNRKIIFTNLLLNRLENARVYVSTKSVVPQYETRNSVVGKARLVSFCDLAVPFVVIAAVDPITNKPFFLYEKILSPIKYKQEIEIPGSEAECVLRAQQLRAQLVKMDGKTDDIKLSYSDSKRIVLERSSPPSPNQIEIAKLQRQLDEIKAPLTAKKLAEQKSLRQQILKLIDGSKVSTDSKSNDKEHRKSGAKIDEN